LRSAICASRSTAQPMFFVVVPIVGYKSSTVISQSPFSRCLGGPAVCCLWRCSAPTAFASALLHSLPSLQTAPQHGQHNLPSLQIIPHCGQPQSPRLESTLRMQLLPVSAGRKTRYAYMGYMTSSSEGVPEFKGIAKIDLQVTHCTCKALQASQNPRLGLLCRPARAGTPRSTACAISASAPSERAGCACSKSVCCHTCGALMGRGRWRRRRGTLTRRWRA
jgi:hypothetical protein